LNKFPTAAWVGTNHFTVLIDCPPKVMLLAIDFDDDFIDEKGVAVASMISL
jgi:hypothetical protein